MRSANVREAGLDPSDLVFMSEQSNRILAKNMVRTGDVLTVRTGYPGTSCVVSPEFDGANCVDIIISRPSTEIDSAFLATWINSDSGKGQVLRVQGGLAQQHFNVGELQKLLIAKPSIEEQRKIQAILDTHEKRIRQEQAYLNKLKLQKQGLMQDLLTGKVRVRNIK
ncbi:MAG: restriction endonuclease subunit S [Gloeotrichia echinulata GP01]